MSGSTNNKSGRCHAVVRNIPNSFHSSDLRRYFSQVIEEKSFACFHYKHRPELLKVKDKEGHENEQRDTCACITVLYNVVTRDRFISMYNDMNWINGDGEYLKEKCVILKVSVSDEKTQPDSYFTQAEKHYKRRHADVEQFSNTDLSNLQELNPPANVMPNGNVGTPIPVFLELIKQCQLPPRVIKKLGLVFPKTASHRRYGNVPYEYKGRKVTVTNGSNAALTADGHEVTALVVDAKSMQMPKENEIGVSGHSEEDEEKVESSSESDDDGCEEWERHEALHSDVTSQERSKERLFEEEIELKWEKGGSGLVFYTDAQYWADEDGDFDEQTTDDWDVDMSEYYGGHGDRDAKDFIKFQKEKRLRAGRDLNAFGHELGKFEKHTKGIGRRIMEELGWDDKKTLGSGRKEGLLEPIEAEGQSSRERRGLGYHGEKLKMQQSIVGKPYIPKVLEKLTKERITSLPNPSEPINKDVHHVSEDFKLQHKVQQRVSKSSFPHHGSVEPLASHSYLFPQFRSNLTSVTTSYKTRGTSARKTAVPGEDGIVITTKFDEPLDIDVDAGIMRSQNPASLKRRITHSSSDKTANESGKVELITPVRTGSKLVKRYKPHTEEYTNNDDHSDNKTADNYHPTHFLAGLSVKFVRPSDSNENTN